MVHLSIRIVQVVTDLALPVVELKARDRVRLVFSLYDD